MSRKKKRNKKKLTTLEQILEYLNDPSRLIKQVSREFFRGTDIGTRRHKDKTKYSRKVKHKKGFTDDD